MDVLFVYECFYQNNEKILNFIVRLSQNEILAFFISMLNADHIKFGT